MSLDAPITPYGKATAGSLVDSVSGSNVGGIGAGNALGLGGGIGIQSRIGQTWGLFAESMLMGHLGSDSFSYLNIHVGANFYFGGNN